jgi:hypothetical protein
MTLISLRAIALSKKKIILLFRSSKIGDAIKGGIEK